MPSRGTNNRIRSFTLLAVATWTLVVAALFLWIVSDNRNQALDLARHEARANIRKDLAIRRWAAMHGGVYVAPDARTPPNPYLKVPNRDVVTTGGRQLTLMNPAYVLRQVQQRGSDDEFGVRGHLTSLKLLNPANAPDPWERETLETFERGETERTAESMIEGKPYMRVMLAVYTERDCLKCHAEQGYREGDVRGGLSASVPLQTYLEHSRQELQETLLAQGAVLLLGYCGIGFFSRRAHRHEAERQRHEEELLAERAGLQERVRAQTGTLQQALEEARSADRAKDAFLATMSHEMRTPLNAIVGFSQLAAQHGGDERTQRYLAQISEASTSLQDIINDLLDISKIAADRMVLETLPFSLNELLARQTATWRDRAEEKGLEFSLQAADGLPDRLCGDAMRLGQVLNNLLGNAIKFTPRGRIELSVELLSTDADQVRLRFAVRDSGIGMSTAEQARIFTPFVQADASITRQFGGTGLGLAICKRLVGLMGGDIGVVSTPGQGSCFSFSAGFPRAGAETWTEAAGEAPANIRFEGVRVLVAEDQGLNQAIIKEMLEQAGVEVDMVDNGRLALDRLLAKPGDYYDAVLMDIQMPVMDGLAATQALRRHEGLAGLPVISLSAYTLTHEREQFLAAGMSDHLGKPFRSADLYAVLARWVAPAKQRREGGAGSPLAAAAPMQIDGIDCAQGLGHFSGKPASYVRWLRIFAAESPAVVADILAAQQRGDNEAAKRLLHGFKSRAGMLGMTALHAATVELEAAWARSGSEIDSSAWQGIYNRTQQSLSSWLAQDREDAGAAASAPAATTAERLT